MLIFPPYWLRPIIARNSYAIAPTIINTVSSKTKETVAPTRVREGGKVSREELTGYLETSFEKYGLESQIPMAIKTIDCESGFQVDPKHNGISWGVAQFTPDTWKDYGYGNILNPEYQLETMARMWSQGLQKRWDCWRMKFGS
jgi:hypothetical protein